MVVFVMVLALFVLSFVAGGKVVVVDPRKAVL